MQIDPRKPEKEKGKSGSKKGGKGVIEIDGSEKKKMANY